ncbi:response regulator transcription factor [Leptolyngbya sp. FACHB-261]|uniref:response regulator transcription factor n=1 Tax=Leptolyngbya sp. FACHB-261 TaxID=2692806 RepID=UPI001687EB4C|nr:response regulator [Leptolyngbya sp. FACHB-261]MBD2102052.1 response regulator [Leptolyngbya sp. FACHB-261]
MAQAHNKILVVDDEVATRTLVYRYLTKQGYQVESAGDGVNAMATFAQFRPNLVILDLNLPDTSGYRLCQEMQAQHPVFVLMLTSRSDEIDRIQGFSQGADDYITKPFSLVELDRRVKMILASASVQESGRKN